jgi:hypothetical protein
MFNEETGGENLSDHQILIANKCLTSGIVLDPESPRTAAFGFDIWRRASDDSLFEESDDCASGEHESNLGSSLGDTNPNFGSSGIEVESANMTIASVSIFRNVIENRMTGITGNGIDPLVMIANCHMHRDETNGLRYNGNLCGIIGRFDHMCKPENQERNLLLGAAIGDLKRNIQFCGSVSEKIISVK